MAPSDARERCCSGEGAVLLLIYLLYNLLVVIVPLVLNTFSTQIFGARMFLQVASNRIPHVFHLLS